MVALGHPAVRARNSLRPSQLRNRRHVWHVPCRRGNDWRLPRVVLREDRASNDPTALHRTTLFGYCWAVSGPSGPSPGRQTPTTIDQRRPILTYETPGQRLRPTPRTRGDGRVDLYAGFCARSRGRRPSISACRCRQAPAAYPQARAGSPRTPAQAAPCGYGPLGLAPGGVYRATPVTRGAGGLLPHRFTLTGRSRRSVLCGTVPRVTPGCR